LNSAIAHLDSAYSNFFQRVKSKSQAPGFPKFKKKSHKQSYTASKTSMNDLKIYEEINRIQIPKVGKVKISYHRPFTGRITSANITLTATGKYFIALTCVECPIEIDDAIQLNPVIGLDVGIKSFLVDSDGKEVSNPKFLRKSEKAVKRAARQLSRKKKGSNNYNKQRIRLAKKHEKVANQRKDFLHKLSTYYAKNHSVICIEDLQVSNMVRNHALAKSISDASWSMFTSMLQYKTNWSRTSLVKIDKFFPSSQLCSNCGYKNTSVKDLAIRKWTCPQCNEVHDRDYNAAKNILKEGMRRLVVS
jgi:putative transposase